jgi:hypothetical protein
LNALYLGWSVTMARKITQEQTNSITESTRLTRYALEREKLFEEAAAAGNS